MIEQTLFTELTANAALGALIGQRLYPQPPKGIPQGSPLPAITYQRISSVRTYTPTGRSGSITSRFQLNVFGASELQSRQVSDALVKAFDTLTLKNFLYGPVDRSDPYTQSIFPSVDAVVWHHESL